MTETNGVAQGNRADAVALCERGFAIIPLLPRSKIPAIPSRHPGGGGRCRGECGELGHGFRDARAEPQWADRLWSRCPAWGIGARPRPGQLVLDGDPRHGGDVALAGLQECHGVLPETFTVITGRGDGGRHLWFRGAPEQMVSRLCQGVDVLSHDRGMAVMPPSLHPDSGLPYRIQEPGVGIADAPSWLVELVRRPEPKTSSPRPRRRRSPMEVRRQGRGLIRVVAGAPAGERHKSLYWAASRAAEDGLLVDVDDQFGVALADAAYHAGLYYREIEPTITDAIWAAHAGRGW